MPAKFTTGGLVVPTFSEALAEVQDLHRGKFGQDVATAEESFLGRLQRIQARIDTDTGAVLTALLREIDPRYATGYFLDLALAAFGVKRLAAEAAEATVTLGGTPGTVIVDGRRVTIGGVVFQTLNGPYTIGGGGTVTGRVRADEMGYVDVVGLGSGWTILDSVAGWDTITTVSQPILGRLTETPEAYRTRAYKARYAGIAGLAAAMESSVSQVPGVVSVVVYANTTGDPADASGVPLHAIHPVIEGGDPEAVASALANTAPPGHLFHGAQEFTVFDGPRVRVVRWDIVTVLTMWVRIELVTSSSEEEPTSGLEDAAAAAAVEYGAGLQAGVDVIPSRIAAACAGFSGVDGVTVTLSLDDGATDPYTSAKRSVSNTQRASIVAARITVTQV